MNKKYRIIFSMCDGKTVTDFNEIEDPEKYLEDFRYEGTYVFTREERIYHSINLSRVNHVEIVEYNPPTTRNAKAYR